MNSNILISKAIKENNYNKINDFINEDYTNLNYIYSNIDISVKKNKDLFKNIFSNLKYANKLYILHFLFLGGTPVDIEKFKLIIPNALKANDVYPNHNILDSCIIKCCIKTKNNEIINNWLNAESILFNNNNNSFNLSLIYKELFLTCCDYYSDNISVNILLDKILEKKIVPDYIIYEKLSSVFDYNCFKKIYLNLNETQRRKYKKSIDRFYFITNRVSVFIERINDEQLKINLEQSVEEEINLKNNKTKRKI